MWFNSWIFVYKNIHADLSPHAIHSESNVNSFDLRMFTVGLRRLREGSDPDDHRGLLLLPGNARRLTWFGAELGGASYVYSTTRSIQRI